jgi:hypothetical protein
MVSLPCLKIALEDSRAGLVHLGKEQVVSVIDLVLDHEAPNETTTNEINQRNTTIITQHAV